MSLSKPAQQLPREILDEIVSYVEDYEDDEAYVATLYSLTLTCRSYFHAAIPALYHDPIRALASWRHREQRGAEVFKQLGTVLETCPALAQHVWRLTLLADLEYQWDEPQKVGEWIYRLLRACPNVESLDMPVRLEGSTVLAAVATEQLPRLQHLTLEPTSNEADLNDDLTAAQEFVHVFRPPNNQLKSLTLSRFPKSAEGPLKPFSPVPFAISTLIFNENQESSRFAASFVPLDPANLKSIVIDYTSVERFAHRLEIPVEFHERIAPFVRRVVCYDQPAVLTDAPVSEYEEQTSERPHFSFTDLFTSTFLVVEEIVMEGLAGLSTAAIVTILSSCPALRSVSFADTTWDLDTWSDSESICSNLRNALSSSSHLRKLHVGFLPISRFDTSFKALQQFCKQQDIDFEWQSCCDSSFVDGDAS